MKIHNMIQGGTEWEEIRWGKIGGTRSKGLFVKSDTLLYELLAEITESYTPDYDTFESADMLRGHELEPLARQAVCEFTGVEFNAVGWLQCEEIPLLGISPDGISANRKITAEFKCPGAKKHIQNALSKDIPPDYIHQSVHYFTVNPECKLHYWASFRPESPLPLVVRSITLDSVVNFGTLKTPKMVTVRDMVAIAKKEAEIIQTEINKSIQLLNF